MTGTPDYERHKNSCVGSGIAYYQFRKVHATMKFWGTCGKFTYDLYKDDQAYEVRRLVIFDETLRS